MPRPGPRDPDAECPRPGAAPASASRPTPGLPRGASPRPEADGPESAAGKQYRCSAGGGSANAAKYPVLLDYARRLPVASQACDRGRVPAPPTYFPVGSRTGGQKLTSIGGSASARDVNASYVRVEPADVKRTSVRGLPRRRPGRSQGLRDRGWGARRRERRVRWRCGGPPPPRVRARARTVRVSDPTRRGEPAGPVVDRRVQVGRAWLADLDAALVAALSQVPGSTLQYQRVGL